MASTIQLSRTVSHVRKVINRAPVTFPNPLDPALLMADWVRQFILSPPFKWRWNRNTTSVTCVIGQQDYLVNLPDFGWLEQAAITDSVGGHAYQLTVALDLAEESVQNQPNKVAARLDDNAGNITFRITPPPDKAYLLAITYQKLAPTFVNITDTWAPIPDYLSYLYTNGLLAKAYEYFDDSRSVPALQLFVRQLVGCSAGLGDSQIDVVVADSINLSRTSQS